MSTGHPSHPPASPSVLSISIARRHTRVCSQHECHTPTPSRFRRSEIRFNAEQLPSGKAANIALRTFKQLEQTGQAKLRILAQNLRDQIGADALPRLSARDADGLIAWILDVQVSMCASIGLTVTFADFGMPADFGEVNDGGYFGDEKHHPMCANNYLDADYNKPLSEVQPAHRNISLTEAAKINEKEAKDAAQSNRQRGNASFVLG